MTLLARAMRDTPIHVAALGDDARKRERRLRRMFSTLFRTTSTQRPLGARAADDDRLVGIAGMTPAGGCQPGGRQRFAMTATIATFGPRAGTRTLEWLDAWAARDLAEPHVHLGPVAVDPDHRGAGIAGALLGEHASRLDATGTVGFLETDSADAVRLYERFGYAVADRADVLDVPCFWLRREPQRASDAQP